MGISAIVTIPATILLGSYLSLRNHAPAYILFPILQASLVGFTAAIAAHPSVNKTALFGKSPDGDFPWWSYATFYPISIWSQSLCSAEKNEKQGVSV
ncbi:unnamed protein product [Calypogeia fissa]